MFRAVVDTERARRWGIRVGHSLNVVAELPRYVDDPMIPLGLRVAAIDAFFIHHRLLIEFLTRKRDQRDIRSHDYVGGFDLRTIDPDLYARLDRDWLVASKQVAHMSVERDAPVDAPFVEFVGATRLRAHASDIFDAMSAFVRYLADKTSPYTPDFAGWLSEANSRRQAEPSGTA